MIDKSSQHLALLQIKTFQAKSVHRRQRSKSSSSAKPDASQTSVFVCRRPEDKRQQKLQALADKSPQVQHLAQLQVLVDSSPCVQVQAQLQAMIDNSPRLVGQRQQMKLLYDRPSQRQEGFNEDELQKKVVQKQVPEEVEELKQGEIEPVQRQGQLEEEEHLQDRSTDTVLPMQRQGVEDQRENRTGMPDPLKAGLEQISGIDLSDVRMHYDSPKPADVNALAYAQGQDIHLGPGQEQQLPHEGWHAVQQMQRRVKPTIQLQGILIDDDVGLEREADVMGSRAAMYQSTKPTKPDSTEYFRVQQRDEVKGSRGMKTRDPLDRARFSAQQGTIQAFFSAATISKYQHAVNVWTSAHTDLGAFNAKLNAILPNNNPNQDNPTLNLIRANMGHKAERAGGTLLGEAYEAKHWNVEQQNNQQGVYSIWAPGGASGIDVRRYNYNPQANQGGGGANLGAFEVKSAGTGQLQH